MNNSLISYQVNSENQYIICVQEQPPTGFLCQGCFKIRRASLKVKNGDLDQNALVPNVPLLGTIELGLFML